MNEEVFNSIKIISDYINKEDIKPFLLWVTRDSESKKVFFDAWTWLDDILLEKNKKNIKAGLRIFEDSICSVYDTYKMFKKNSLQQNQSELSLEKEQLGKK